MAARCVILKEGGEGMGLVTDSADAEQVGREGWGGGRAQSYPGSNKQHQCLGVLFPQGPGVLPLQKRGARLPRWAANLLSRLVELTLAEASSPEPGLGNNWL